MMSILVRGESHETDKGIVQTTNKSKDCGGESRSGKHNLKVAGASPAPATR